MDATSKKNIGRLFDVVIIGDVIEHVSNPVALLEFSKRHLKKNGKIYVSTPNPYFYSFIINVLKNREIIAHPEHTCWVTPTNALEIGRRANLKLKKYYMLNRKKTHNIFIKLVKSIIPLPLLVPAYIYEFVV